jgi:hypothetical protein
VISDEIANIEISNVLLTLVVFYIYCFIDTPCCSFNFERKLVVFYGCFHHSFTRIYYFFNKKKIKHILNSYFARISACKFADLLLSLPYISYHKLSKTNTLCKYVVMLAKLVSTCCMCTYISAFILQSSGGANFLL